MARKKKAIANVDGHQLGDIALEGSYMNRGH